MQSFSNKSMTHLSFALSNTNRDETKKYISNEACNIADE